MKILFGSILLMLLPLAASANPNIVVSTSSEKEIVEKKNGKIITRRVKASSVNPGQKLIFTIRYSNSGTSAAKDVVLNNPIPENAVYVSKSARGKKSVITFSVDGGKTFTSADKLLVRYADKNGKQKKIKATAKHYTHVRWTVSSIDAGSNGRVSYAVRVK